MDRYRGSFPLRSGKLSTTTGFSHEYSNLAVGKLLRLRRNFSILRQQMFLVSLRV
ncbi:hypothetical protein ALC62_02601 [Cyphomyrmex costatus]|uniref:Uncharacterized protein n=1 Tax=Cyphomyrmex costatus TaxID=456900 RepID=A0A195D0Y2_9HYME|nr:hypothetical protein ALC62_02601 [Cyphomyrmex costatus]